MSRLPRGTVLAYPTESCFGLGCAPLDWQGLRRIMRLKRRPAHKGLIVVAASLAQLRPLLQALSAQDLATLHAHWPGPYTFLIPAARKVPALLRGQHHTLAVRVSAHPEVQRLCRRYGPLVSTSANRSGGRPASSARACHALFGHEVRVWGGRVGGARRPSTIIDLASGRVLR